MSLTFEATTRYRKAHYRLHGPAGVVEWSQVGRPAATFHFVYPPHEGAEADLVKCKLVPSGSCYADAGSLGLESLTTMRSGDLVAIEAAMTEQYQRVLLPTLPMVTKTGRVLTDADVEALAAEAEQA